MALTRKMLKAMGIEDEKIDQIIEAHSDTVDALKDERDGYKTDAEKLKDVQKELDDLKANNGKDDYKKKFDDLKKEYDDYKNDTTAKETHRAKEHAYRELLKAAGISEKRIDTVLKVSEIDKLELDKDGKIKDADNLKKNVTTEWADFIETSGTRGAQTATPPANAGGKTYKTREEIIAIKDGVERRAAIAANPELFGLPVNEK